MYICQNTSKMQITINEIFLSLGYFGLSRGTDGEQNGRKSANIEVKNQKSAKMGTILNAWNKANYVLCLQIVCFSLQIITFPRKIYLPMQKRLKIVPRIWSVVISPVIEDRWWIVSRMSCATKSPEMPERKPSMARSIDCAARVRAS